MTFNLNGRMNDTRSIKPQETEPVTARQQAPIVPGAIMRAQDTRPSSAGLFATMLAGVANIGRTVNGIVQQNNKAIAERDYDKISTEFDQEVAALQGEDLASFPDKFDEVLDRYRERIDGFGRSKGVTDLTKSMLLDNSEDRAYATFYGIITKNKEQLVQNHEDKMVAAIESKDRSKVNRLIYDAYVGENAIFSKEASATQLVKANSLIDQQIVKSELYGMDYNEAMKLLDTPGYRFTVEKGKIVDDPGSETGEKVQQPNRTIELTPEQSYALKKSLTEDDYLDRTAASQQYGDNFENILKFRGEGNKYEQFIVEVKAGKFPGINMNNARDTWDKAGGIFKQAVQAEQQEAFNSFQDIVIQNQNLQGNVRNPIELRNVLQTMKYDMGSDLYADAAALLNIPKEDIIDPIDELSKGISDEIKTKLATGEIDTGEAKVLAANAIESGNMVPEDWSSTTDFYKYFEESNIKGLVKRLSSVTEMNKFKDKNGDIDTGKYNIAMTAIRTIVEEGSGTDTPLNTAQLNERYSSLVTILTKEDALKDLDELERNLRGAGHAWGEGDSDRTVKRLVTGQLSSLRTVDPGKFQEFSTYLNEQAKIIAAKDFPGKTLSDEVRLHENYMPVYRIDGKEYVYDVSDNGKSVVFTPFDEALDKYKNLAYGKPVGTVFEGNILTFDGYKNKNNMVPVNISGSEGYLLKNNEGDPDYDSPAYVMSKNSTGDILFSPIFSPLDDEVAIAAELKNIREVPMTEERMKELNLKSKTDERFNELYINSQPRRF